MKNAGQVRLKGELGSIIIKILFTVFVVYMLIKIATVRMVDIKEKRQMINTYQELIDKQQTKNNNLQGEISRELTEDEIKNIAREDLNLVEAGERVFVNGD